MTPWKCPDCGTWFGVEHRCPTVKASGAQPPRWPSPTQASDTFAVRCTCHLRDFRTPHPVVCLVHDVSLT